MIARTCLLILITMAVQNPAPPELEAGFSRVFAMQQEIRDIHPAFRRLYPIAVVRGGSFHIYEPNAKSYRLATTAPDKFNIPVGIRAAMPLDFWGNRMACVITPEAFDDLGGIILIFHEWGYPFDSSDRYGLWSRLLPCGEGDTLECPLAALRQSDCAAWPLAPQNA